jgi:hypothetical protein
MLKSKLIIDKRLLVYASSTVKECLNLHGKFDILHIP